MNHFITVTIKFIWQEDQDKNQDQDPYRYV